MLRAYFAITFLLLMTSTPRLLRVLDRVRCASCGTRHARSIAVVFALWTGNAVCWPISLVWNFVHSLEHRRAG